MAPDFSYGDVHISFNGGEKNMDTKKICFIICTNDELYESEALYYLNQLIMPEGYIGEILCIKEAVSMCEGYNEGMNGSDAKYKVYLHHDVFIINKNFIGDILKIFNNKEIGMIGMVGSNQLPEHGIMWYGKRTGKIYGHSVVRMNRYEEGMTFNYDYVEVDAVDGLLIATQYDIPWREDLFKGWDFYDVSQSLEFRKKGWKVVIPKMENAWCIHDDGILNFRYYFKYREIFLNEYYNEFINKTSM